MFCEVRAQNPILGSPFDPVLLFRLPLRSIAFGRGGGGVPLSILLDIFEVL